MGVVCLLAFYSSIFGYSGGSGAEGDPYQIADPNDWQVLTNDPNNWDKYFVLVNDIDFGGANLTPVGNSSNKFTGIFDGMGHVIRNTVINLTGQNYVGLFGYLGSGGQIHNLGVENVAVTGHDDVGGLCGYNYNGSINGCWAVGNVNGEDDSWRLGGLCGRNFGGTISNSYATGSVTAGDAPYFLGGLCGENLGTISGCWATGSVTAGEDSYYLGGLCGVNNGMISDCWATGAVNSDGNELGGLCGVNYGMISDCRATGNVNGGNDAYRVGGLCGGSYAGTISGCYATGAVSGGDNSSGLGGLVGKFMSGIITDCYATGSVNGGAQLGGLCASNLYGTISGCYATGAVSGGPGSRYNGGLCGSNSGIISGCYATGAVSGGACVGGLCGSNSDTISGSYASGKVSGWIGNSYHGGLCGNNRGTISGSYATGAVGGSLYVGGLCGWNEKGKVIRCYSTGKPTGTTSVGGLCGGKTTGGSYEDTGNFWDTDTSETTVSVMGTGKTTSEMQMLATFTAAGWDFGDTWSICEGTNYPRLQWQIPAGDWVCPDGVCLEDLEYFAEWWLQENCGTMDDCDGVDLNTDGVVDLSDWAIVAEHWLEGL